MNNKNKVNKGTTDEQTHWMPFCMCIGLSIGLALGGLLFDNSSVGMCLGMSIGVAVGSALDSKNNKSTQVEEKDEV